MEQQTVFRVKSLNVITRFPWLDVGCLQYQPIALQSSGHTGISRRFPYLFTKNALTDSSQTQIKARCSFRILGRQWWYIRGRRSYTTKR